MNQKLKAPFTYFGGKGRAAEFIWAGLGNPPNYVEPFFGSGAVLLNRPGGAGKIETINDLDCDVANFWRAVSIDPEGVANALDWPVNECDLHARDRGFRQPRRSFANECIPARITSTRRGRASGHGA